MNFYISNIHITKIRQVHSLYSFNSFSHWVVDYGMMIFLIGFWCCALESAWQRLSAIKVQNRITLYRGYYGESLTLIQGTLSWDSANQIPRFLNDLYLLVSSMERVHKCKIINHSLQPKICVWTTDHVRIQRNLAVTKYRMPV